MPVSVLDGEPHPNVPATPDAIEASYRRKYERWLAAQPMELQELATTCAEKTPGEAIQFLKKSLLGTIVQIEARKDEIMFGLFHVIEQARVAKSPRNVVSAAKILVDMETKAIELLAGLEKTKITVGPQTIQIQNNNFYTNPDESEEDVRTRARAVLDRYIEVAGGSGADLLDRVELLDPRQEEEASEAPG